MRFRIQVVDFPAASAASRTVKKSGGGGTGLICGQALIALTLIETGKCYSVARESSRRQRPEIAQSGSALELRGGAVQAFEQAALVMNGESQFITVEMPEARMRAGLAPQ